MTAHDVGIFRVIDPPPGALDMVRATVDAITYPWERLYPLLSLDPDRAVLITFDPAMQQGVSGLYYGSRRVWIVLGTRYSTWLGNAPFVLAHEIGHLVDDLALDKAARTALLAHMLDQNAGPRNGQTDPNDPTKPHPWSHDHPHTCAWVAVNDYLHRVNEAFADLFVQAFAPTLWRYPRFSHGSNDPATVRTLTLASETPTMAAILTRLAGATRYGTAAKVSALAFPDPSAVSEVWIATGDAYPDALAAGPAAGHLGAPLLLVPGAAGATLPPDVKAELQRLDPLRVVIVGGTGAVPQTMADQILAALA